MALREECVVRIAVRGGLALLTAGTMCGCASAIQLWGLRDAAPVVEREEDVAEGRRIVVAPVRPADPFWAGALVDAAVTGNLVRLAVTFATDDDVLLGTALGGAAGVLLDAAGVAWIRAAVPRPTLVLIKGANGSEVRVPLTPRGDRLEALIPRSALPPGVSTRASLASEGGVVLATYALRPSREPEAQAIAATEGAATESGPSDVDQPLPKVAPPDPDAVGVVIGVEEHSGSVPPVAFAGRDVDAVSRYLREALGVEDGNVLRLTNTQATMTNMRVTIERKLANRVTPGRSVVYFYFAGHGVSNAKDRVPYLVPFDGDPAYPQDTCYSTVSLYQALGRLKAKRVVVMLDACFTGLSGRDGKTSLFPAMRPLMVTPILPSVPDGVAVLAAAGPDEMSGAATDRRHGLFTYWLLRALRGGSGVPAERTWRDVFGFVRDNVAKDARRQDREQTPVYMGNEVDRWKVER